MGHTSQVSLNIHIGIGNALHRGRDRVRSIGNSSALLPHAVQRVGRGRIHPRQSRAGQAHLDFVRGQRGVVGNHQRRNARDNPSSLRSACQSEVFFAQAIGRVLFCQHRIIRQYRDHVRAWGNQIRLDKAIQRRAGRGERGQVIIIPIVGSIVISISSHRDHVGVVAGYGNAHGVRAAVTRRNDHRHAAGPHSRHGLVERIRPVSRLGRGHQRKVHHADVIAILVFQHPLQTGNNLLVSAIALFIQNTHTDQIDARSDAIPFAICAFLAVGDNAGHMRTMTIGIDRFLVLAIDEVLPGHNAPGFVINTFRQSSQIATQTGIDHRHSHTGAGHTTLPDYIRANHIGEIGRGHALILLFFFFFITWFGAVAGVDGAVQRHRHNAFFQLQLGNSGTSQRGSHSANNLQPRSHHAAMLFNQLGGQIRARRLNDIRLLGSRNRRNTPGCAQKHHHDQCCKRNAEKSN